jgi:hypothetical protein
VPVAKRGIAADDLPSLIKEKSEKAGWVLCIGAGTSVPAFPGWKDLVTSLIEQDVGPKYSDSTKEYLLSRYSYDAIIQSAQDRLKLDLDGFADKLTEHLYSKLRKKANDKEWKTISACLSAKGPADCKPSVWEAFLDWFRKNYKDLTALTLAKLMVRIRNSELAPSAVISFNAEPLLYALTNAAVVEELYYLSRIPPKKGDLRSIFDIVSTPLAERYAGRTPYIFCHGALPVPGGSGRRKVSHYDQLVFSETKYLQLANESFSWQSSAFLSAAITSTIVFVGVSLSDPNMRRWLSYVHAERERELRKHPTYKGASTKHYWFTEDPNNESIRNWVESCVSHLGVRIIWLKKWKLLEEAFNKLLSL